VFGRDICIIQDGSERMGLVLSHRAEQLAQQLRVSKVRCLLVCTLRADTAAIALLAAQEADCGLILSRQPLESGEGSTRSGLADAILSDDLTVRALADAETESDRFAIGITTSGTTGRPKLAWHSLDALLGRIRSPDKASAETVRWLLTYHPMSFAGLQVMLTALAGGATLIASSAPSAAVLTNLAMAYRPTHVSATPTFWRTFLVALGKNAASLAFRQITAGGESVDQATLDRLSSAFPQAGIAHIYASTEAGALFSVRDKRAGFPVEWLSRPIEDVELRIRDGVLEVRSPRMMLRYGAQTAAAPVVDADGWISTQDRVAVKADRVEFLGRMDSMINVGGAKVSPEQVEAALLAVPGVVDARVYGAKNPITGEIVAADVCLQPGVSEAEARVQILSQVRSSLHQHEVPRLLRFVDTLAVSEAGKKVRAT
jgi:acyl-coenzyme A synthetase/AMP-(fatty) acid ligase